MSSMMKKEHSNVNHAVIGVLIVFLAIGVTFTNIESASAADRVVGFTYKLVVAVPGKAPQVQTLIFTEAYNIGEAYDIIEERKTKDAKGVETINYKPGTRKALSITLKRPLAQNYDLRDWFNSQRVAPLKKGYMVLHAVQNNVIVAQWNLMSAWPSKYIINPLETSTASSSGVQGIETLVITCDEAWRAK
jgi:hypothetical protein